MNLNNEMIDFGIPILEDILKDREEWLHDDFAMETLAMIEYSNIHDLRAANMKNLVEISFFKALINHLKFLQEKRKTFPKSFLSAISLLAEIDNLNLNGIDHTINQANELNK